jgi:hypothetical protein
MTKNLFDILSFPDVIINDVLSHWLLIEEVCFVDTSFCNSFRRLDFKLTLKRREFQQNGTEDFYYNQKGLFFYKWIFMREIKLLSVYLLVQNKMEFNELIRINLSSTNTLKLTHYEPEEGNIVYLINSCENLKELSLKNCKISDTVLKTFPRLEQLKLFEFYSNSIDCTMNSISTLAHKCVMLETLVLIFCLGNGDSQYVDVNTSLLELFQSNTALKHIEIDLIDEWSQSNNTNLTFLRDMTGECANLQHCDLKYYGVFDVSQLTCFLLNHDALQFFNLDIVDPNDGSNSEYYFHSCLNTRIISISNHTVVNNNEFGNLFQMLTFTEIVLDRVDMITDDVIRAIASNNNLFLQSITIKDCGHQWTANALSKLLSSCSLLRCLTLTDCIHINFTNVLIELPMLSCLCELEIKHANLSTEQLICFLMLSKNLTCISIAECSNVNMVELRLFLLKEFPEHDVFGDSEQTNTSARVNCFCCSHC